MTAGTPCDRGVPSGLTSSLPLNSWTVAGTGCGTAGRASGVAVPDPIFEPDGQAEPPTGWLSGPGMSMSETLQTPARSGWNFRPLGPLIATCLVDSLICASWLRLL